MCIKIVKDHIQIPYEPSKPLDEQIQGSEQIIVNYELFDKSIDTFLQEVDRLAKIKMDSKLTIKVIHNDHIFGFKVKQKLKKATNDMALNEIIKLMVLSHVETDKKLEELAHNFTGIAN